VILVNARDSRNMPGRKTDVSDAAWLADLGAHGLVRASFVPPPPIRELRDLSRARTVITRERSREIQRLEKLLEDACIKLSSVASDIIGVSGRLMLEALILGQDDPAALADLAQRRMRSKIPELTQALTGRFSEHHGFMTRLYLHRIDAHTDDIHDLDNRIEQAMVPFRHIKELLVSMPGVSATVAEVFIAETGGDIRVFPTAGQLASGAGTPGSNESAGRTKPTKTREGNHYLKGALRIAALAASRSRGTYFSARYKLVASRRGPTKALVAVERTMLTAAWHMLSTGELYLDPGADYFTQRAPARAKCRAISQLESLGFKVTIEPLL
jgi:transposase